MRRKNLAYGNWEVAVLLLAWVGQSVVQASVWVHDSAEAFALGCGDGFVVSATGCAPLVAAEECVVCGTATRRGWFVAAGMDLLVVEEERKRLRVGEILFPLPEGSVRAVGIARGFFWAVVVDPTGENALFRRLVAHGPMHAWERVELHPAGNLIQVRDAPAGLQLGFAEGNGRQRIRTYDVGPTGRLVPAYGRPWAGRGVGAHLADYDPANGTTLVRKYAALPGVSAPFSAVYVHRFDLGRDVAVRALRCEIMGGTDALFALAVRTAAEGERAFSRWERHTGLEVRVGKTCRYLEYRVELRANRGHVPMAIRRVEVLEAGNSTGQLAGSGDGRNPDANQASSLALRHVSLPSSQSPLRGTLAPSGAPVAPVSSETGAQDAGHCSADSAPNLSPPLRGAAQHECAPAARTGRWPLFSPTPHTKERGEESVPRNTPSDSSSAARSATRRANQSGTIGFHSTCPISLFPGDAAGIDPRAVAGEPGVLGTAELASPNTQLPRSSVVTHGAPRGNSRRVGTAGAMPGTDERVVGGQTVAPRRPLVSARVAPRPTPVSRRQPRDSGLQEGDGQQPSFHRGSFRSELSGADWRVPWWLLPFLALLLIWRRRRRSVGQRQVLQMNRRAAAVTLRALWDEGDQAPAGTVRVRNPSELPLLLLGPWQPLPPLPRAAAGHSLLVYRGLLYCVGRDCGVLVATAGPRGLVWRTLRAALPACGIGAAFGIHNRGLVVIVGSAAQCKTPVLWAPFTQDGGLGEFVEVASLPIGVAHAGCVTLPGLLLIAGGMHRERPTDWAFHIDAAWRVTPAPPLPFPTVCPALLPTEYGVIAAGGRDETGRAIRSVLRLEGTRWHRLPPLPEPRTGTALATINNWLYAFGGAGAVPSARVFRLPLNGGNQWTPAPFRLPLPLVGAALATAGDVVVLCGGRSPAQPGGPLADVFLVPASALTAS